MAGVEPVSSTSGAAASSGATGADATSESANAKIQQAFAQGIVQYMGSMLESMESDIQQACDDDTSDPDAPS